MDQGVAANSTDSENLNLQCNTCGKYYRSFSSLNEHYRTHTGERPYACQICFKRFTQKAHLIIHKRTHTGEKPYACHICNKRFAQTSHLNSHKRIHTGEKPYSCNICNIGFCRKKRLELHILQHTQADQITAGQVDPNSVSHVSLTNGYLQQDGGLTIGSTGQQNSFSNVTPDVLDFFNVPGQSCAVEPSVSPLSSASSHRRKPAFVQRVGNIEDTDVSTGNVKTEFDDEEVNAEFYNSDQPQNHKSETWKNNQNDRKEARHKDKNILPDGIGQAVFPNIPGSSVESDERKSEDNIGIVEIENKTDLQNSPSGDDGDNVSVTSDSNQSSSDLSIPHMVFRQSLLSHPSVTAGIRQSSKSQTTNESKQACHVQSMIRTNSRISLVDFTADDLIRHLMSRDDVHRCDFCCIVFQDAAMYHLHRSMHDKMDIRCCNLCGKLLQDKYDFTAHFLSEHKLGI